MSEKVRVLIVDDSAMVREILSQGLSQDPEIEVVGKAADPFAARDMILDLRPDVLTLDVEMPKMDGVEFLRRLMPQHPMPVLMVSALTQKGKRITMEALEAGAVDFVTKPSTDISRGLNEMLGELQAKVKAVSKAPVKSWNHKKPASFPSSFAASRALSESSDKVVAIGASTGGTQAINSLIKHFPAAMPGVVVVQHMPAGFTRMFAERLDKQSAMSVKEAETGDRVMMGRVLIAPGDFHMSIVRSGGIYKVNCKKGEKVNGHRPSVEALFDSVAKYVGVNAVGVMLTGMGSDGADAMVAMRKAGCRTLAQDEATSVVFGMPKEAYIRGGAERLVPLHDIAHSVMGLLVEKR